MQKISLCGRWSFFPGGSGKAYDAEVPGSWKAIPGLSGCTAGLYRRSFTLDAEQLEKRLVLRFGGVFRRAEVRLNGKELGRHNGFQSPFSFDVTDAAAPGENILEVAVDSVRPGDEYLGLASVFESVPHDFEGIYEPVTLELSERTALTGFYSPADMESGKALFIFDVHSEAAEAGAKNQSDTVTDSADASSFVAYAETR